jgi:amino acid adenylation domain-containing protein
MSLSIATTVQYPLSFEQQRLWFVNQLNPGTSAYNAPCAARIAGPLRMPVLKKALGDIVGRHEVLRTRIEAEDGQPIQVVSAPLPVEPEVIDLRADVDRETRAIGLLMEQTARPFDLAVGPLFRVVVFQMAEDDHILLIAIHHLISDAWSAQVLMRDFVALYEAAAVGKEPDLPALKVQYGEYCEWQHRWLKTKAAERMSSYWKEYLRGDLPDVALRPDRSPDKRAEIGAAACSAALSLGVVKALRTISLRQRCTLPIVLLGSINLLLSRLTGLNDIIVGTAVAKRTRVEVENLIGLFVNVIAIRTELSGNPTFSEAAARTRDAAFGAYAHQELPFDAVVDSLRPAESSPDLPLFTILFNYLNIPAASPGGRDAVLGITPIRLPQTEFHYPLGFDVEEHGDTVRLQLLYQTALFSPERVQCLLDQWACLLEQIAGEPDRPIAEYSLVTPSARAVLPESDAALPVSPRERVAQAVLRHAAQTPAAPALRYENRTWTYGELANHSTAIAMRLTGSGVRAGDVVAIVGEKSYGLVATIIGTFLSGAATVLVDAQTPAARRRELYRLAAPRCSLRVTTEAAEPWSDEGATLGLVSAQGDLINWRAGCAPPESARVVQDDAAYIVFTSGSTGVSKGVIGRHGGLSHFVAWERDTFGIGAGDCCPQLASLAVDVIYREIFVALASGALLSIPPQLAESSPDGMLAWLDETRATVIHTVPSILQNWLTEVPSGVSLSALRRLFLVGEPLAGGLVRRWRSRFPQGQIVNLYGATETNLAKCYYVVPAEPEPGIQPAGSALPETMVLVCSPAGRLCGIGEPGEVVFRSGHLSAGYIHATAQENSRFGEMTYRTGDLGMYLPDGRLQLLGRMDRQVKINGVRVNPDETAAVLSAHPAVVGCYVHVLDGPDGAKRLVAYVMRVNQEGSNAAELRSHLTAKLPPACVPSHFVFVERLPLNEGGKIDASALPEFEDSDAAGLPARTSLVSPTQELLLDIWRRLLTRDVIGIDDSFFELGGNSLLATRIVSQVRKVFNIQIPLAAIFITPTVRGVAAEVDRELYAGASRAPALIRRRGAGGSGPLSHAQQGLWFLDQLTPGVAAYNVSTAARVNGPLNVSILEGAVSELVSRHEILRTRFVLDGAEPVQIVENSSAVPVRTADLRDRSAADRATELERVSIEESESAFDLSQGPLLRLKLARMAEDEHVLFVTMHHIVSDGWSIGVLVSELTILYNAYSQGRRSPLPELDLQYVDYSLWQREWLRGEALEEHLSYWREQLLEVPELNLPAYRTRPAHGASPAGNVTAVFSGELSEAITRLSRAENVTPFMTTLAAFLAILSRATGQTDMVVGAPVAGRNRAELEPLIGLFVNTLVLRTDLSGNPSFRELLRRVRKTTLDAYSHQELPFDTLVQHLEPERRLDANPLFSVMFQLDHVAPIVQSVQALSVQPMQFAPRTAKLDLLMMIKAEQGSYEATLQYRCDMFSEPTMRRMLDQFRTVLERAAENPAASILACSQAAPTELDRNQFEFARTLLSN